jgi:hypothetical protein
MNVSIIGGRSELGRVLAQQSGTDGTGDIHINLAGQRASTLLHDGHAWTCQADLPAANAA